VPEGSGFEVKSRTGAGRDALTAGRDVNITTQHLAPGYRDASEPRLLPRQTPGFTGRERELARIAELASRGSTIVIAVMGAAGIGKSALVVRAAYELTSAPGPSEPPFPGGHLHADLHGFDRAGQPPADPGEVLGDFLRGLGVREDEVPQRTEGRSLLFRQLLASRRTLLVLDNAVDVAQISPLLPGEGASVALVTSQSNLAGLEAEFDERIYLDVLSSDDATVLMTRLIGAQRASAEPGALADAVGACGGLPLALHIAGQWVAVGEQRSVGQLARGLADERSRLDQLAVGDRSVRAAFEVSYRQLPKADARVFRLLGLYPGTHFDKDVIDNLAGFGDLAAAAAVLDRLAAAHLITGDGTGRFLIHDLLRLFARETCEANDDDDDRAGARERVVNYFAKIAWFLDTCLNPRQRRRFEENFQSGAILYSQRSALAEFEAERANLVAAVNLAAGQGAYETVLRLSDHLGSALALSGHLDDLLTVRTAALAAARSIGEAGACGRALDDLGNAYLDLRQFTDAIRCFEEELAICEESGDRAGEGLARGNLGMVYSGLRQFERAIGCYQRGLEICREIGEKYASGQILGNLGNAYQQLGELDRAIELYDDALRVSYEIDDQHRVGQVLNNLGAIYLKKRRFTKAIECFKDDRAICRRLGDESGEALSLGNLGNTYFEQGDFSEAIAHYQDALAICRKLGDRYSEGQALVNLAIASNQLGRRDQAASYLRDAARAMRDSGDHEAAARYEEAVPDVLSRRLGWGRAPG
jgi:tetratricopeptide (TPR) repeat protein